MIVLNYLSPRGMLKVSSLSRGIRSSFYGNVFIQSRFMGATYKQRIEDYKYESDKHQDLIHKQERNINYLKEQDSIRNQLMNNVSEERIKDIIHRYIVKPKYNKAEDNDVKIFSQQMEQTVSTCETFLEGYINMHYKHLKA